MRLKSAQQTISDDANRFRCVSAGRRFGKSMLSINEMAKFGRYPKRKILYVAPTYRQAKTVIWDELKEQLIKRRWVKKINESELQIRLINDTVITIRSGETKDALRGGKYDFIVLDECADIDPDVWYMILRPTLSDTGGHALFIGTPKSMNWFYDLWLQAGITADWSAYQFTTLQGENVPEVEIEAARRDMDARSFEQEFEAKFVNYAGVIFYSYSEANIKPHAGIDSGTPIHCGIDFNVTPLVCVIATKNATGLHIFDEIEIHSSNTAEMCSEIRTRYGYQRPIFMYPDASGAKRTTNSPGLSDHIILHNAGFKVVTDAANPPVAEAIASVNALLCNGSGQRNLYIDPGCKRLREVMHKYVYKPDTRVPDKDSGYDHMADALRYLVHKTFPLKMLSNINSGKSYRQMGRIMHS
jgi:Terminase large subunit, T4likevirus-type, N-terminal